MLSSQNQQLPLSNEFGGISGAVGLLCLFSFHSNKTGCLHGQEDVLGFLCFWSHGLVNQDLLVLRLKSQEGWFCK